MMDRVHRSRLTFACVIAALSVVAPTARAVTANWATSGLDMWFYTNAVSPSSRALAPTFLGGVSINPQTQQFNPLTVTDPARLGMALLAFDTSTQITPKLPAGQYQINSVTFKATWTYDSDPNKLLYRDTPVSQSEMLAEVAGNNVTRQKPMELYGAGLRQGYTGYQFGNTTGSGPLLSESTGPYSASDGGYVAYPTVGSATQTGSYVDVSNSVTGGYSATEPTNNTAPFTPTPWAIGKTNLSPGDQVPDKTTFTFTLDLNQPGVRQYIQQSLFNGGIGFFLSSLDSTGEFGSGGGYPRWYMKESAGFPYFVPPASLPQLTIDYSILPAGVPGDYNGDGVVNAADYVLWRKGGPLQNQVDDPSLVTPQDYVEWRARFGNLSGSGTSGGLGNQSVPEPSTVIMLAIFTPLLARTKHGRTRR
jgi:hypothetical protein